MRPTMLLAAAALALSLTSCSGADSGGAGATGSPTSTAPTDVEVAADATAPGTDLAFAETATLVWQPTTDLTGVLELSVDSVAEQRPSVLDGWARDESVTASRPYFVGVTLTNVGESDLAEQIVPLYLRDGDGALGAPWTIGGDFDACQSGPLPSPFAPGDEAEVCLLYLAPDGGRIQDMVFEPTEGYDPITWTGEVDEPRRERQGRTKRDRR